VQKINRPLVIRSVKCMNFSIPNLIDHKGFIQMLSERFPEVPKAFNEIDEGLLHCETAVFRGIVEAAMDNKQDMTVRNYLEFVAYVLDKADSGVRNAIEVSFLEDFALGEYNQNRHKAVKELMPKILRDNIIEVDNKWA